MHLFSQKCKHCGKEIFPNPQWVYKRGSDYYCSWKCYRRSETVKPKKEIVLPKVGDTIKIIYVSGINSYTGKTGVVEFYDMFGQLHGTWGGWVVIPGEDIYEIIEEKTNG